MTLENKPKANKTQDSLLAALQRKLPPKATVAVAADPQKPRGTRIEAPAAKSKRRIGKATQFWFHEEDRRFVRELVAWLSGQGLRVTDSMVIRAALRTARPGDDLLKACREAADLDGRLKRHKLQNDQTQ
jgi:hypothetical protein